MIRLIEPSDNQQVEGEFWLPEPPAVRRQEYDDPKDREKDILAILMGLEVAQGAEFETKNIAAWRTAFLGFKSRYERDGGDKKEFEIKKQSKETYRIWRKK